jgi:hypothetical protein
VANSSEIEQNTNAENPTVSRRFGINTNRIDARYHPSKLIAGVRFPSPALKVQHLKLLAEQGVFDFLRAY